MIHKWLHTVFNIMWYVSKGIAYFDVWVDSADTDIHSSKGAVVNNAAWRLVHALASLRTPLKIKLILRAFMKALLISRNF